MSHLILPLFNFNNLVTALVKPYLKKNIKICVLPKRGEGGGVQQSPKCFGALFFKELHIWAKWQRGEVWLAKKFEQFLGNFDHFRIFKSPRINIGVQRPNTF